MGKRPPSKDEVVDAIRRVTLEYGGLPSRRAFKKSTEISHRQVLKHFLSWNDAVEAAGFDPNRSRIPLEDSALLEDWGTVVRKLREIPTTIEYRHYGGFSEDTLQRHFGSWSTIPDTFRQFAQNKPDWSDVVALLPVSAGPPTSRLSSPSSSDPSMHPDPVGARIAPKTVHSRIQDRSVYGNPIDFRGLRHEPVNENGVIFLFGMVARELGYSVETIQQGFPDCEAKRMVSASKWQRVKIEFEYESRNFHDHGHPADGCDVIVCWRQGAARFC